MPRHTYHDRNERVIDSLQEGLRPLARFIMFMLARIGEDILLVEGFRTKEDQDREYAEGDSFVVYPYSFHNHGVAVDVAPILFGQKNIILWRSRRYRRIARIFMRYGFEWGYALWLFDKPHMQFRQEKNIMQFVDGYKIRKEHYLKMIADELNHEEMKIRNGMGFAKPKRLMKLRDELDMLYELRQKIL